VADANFDSRVHYLGGGGGAHCPLIKGVPPIRAWGGGVGHFDQAHLEINSNILHLNFHGSILNSKLETKTRLNVYFLTD
jgi:hypothetical protein